MSVTTAGALRRGRPPKSDRRTILAAAVALADDAGLDAVTIRQVAARAGVAPMTVYSYVRNIDELVDLVVTELVARAAESIDRPARLDDALLSFGRALRRLVLEHPAVLHAVQRRAIRSADSLAVSDHLLERLLDAGYSPQDAIDAYVTLQSFVFGFVAAEHGRAAARERHGAQDDDQAFVESITEQAVRYPTLARLSTSAALHFEAEQFERSLGQLVRMLAAPGPPPPQSRRPRGSGTYNR